MCLLPSPPAHSVLRCQVALIAPVANSPWLNAAVSPKVLTRSASSSASAAAAGRLRHFRHPHWPVVPLHAAHPQLRRHWPVVPLHAAHSQLRRLFPIVLADWPATNRLPCLLLAGTEDKMVPAWYAEAAARPWFPNVRLEMVKGGNHNGCLRPSAADAWDRPLQSGVERSEYQMMLAGKLGAFMRWTSKFEVSCRPPATHRPPACLLAHLPRRLSLSLCIHRDGPCARRGQLTWASTWR